VLQKLKYFLNPFDQRYEDLARGNLALNVLRDVVAGLIVAMVAIPLAMGFAMASGLRPEQGIIGGAVAGLIGALWGGSKYQVYGPTAAFIPIIAGIMAARGYGFLILASICAGVVLCLMGVLELGRYVEKVPHSIVVGFTIGIAATIAVSQMGEVFGFSKPVPYKFLDKLAAIGAQFGSMSLWSVAIAVGTVIVTKTCLRISVFLPGPLVALALGVVLTQTVLRDAGLALVSTKYGEIPSKAWLFTPPPGIEWSAPFLADLAYYSMAIVFVAAIESLLCSRMADRLANNKGTPFNPNKELWGQGMVNMIIVLMNGFPHTGALARTATNIKLGAISPLAGISKFALKLVLAFYLASYLERVPMACIGGILLFVAMNMVKRTEVDEVLHMGKAHIVLMAYTAVAVFVTDFLTGVLTALAGYVVWQKFGVKKAAPAFALPGALSEAGRNRLQPSGLRAALGPERALARRPAHYAHGTDRAAWSRHIRHSAQLSETAFVHSQASVIGRVVLGDHVHVAAGTSIRADEGTPFFIGSSSNVQDGVIMHALKERWVNVAGENWAVFVGQNVSIAHGAIVHGPCYIGDDSFVGFKATVHDSVVGARCSIGIGAVVVGVEIPDGKYVPHGAIIDSAAKVALLPNATASHAHFNEDVVDVNRGLAAAYREKHAPEPRQHHPSLFTPETAPALDRF
jgi:sulfate permease, SulP family